MTGILIEAEAQPLSQFKELVKYTNTVLTRCNFLFEILLFLFEYQGGEKSHSLADRGNTKGRKRQSHGHTSAAFLAALAPAAGSQV